MQNYLQFSHKIQVRKMTNIERFNIANVNVSYLNVKRGMGNDRKHQARNL